MAPADVTTWHLEQRSHEELRPAPAPGSPVGIEQVELPSPELNRFLYAVVGNDWWWYTRLSWTREEWMAYLDRPELETWVVYERGTPAGYFEQERQPEGDVEIVYFGLLPHAIGRGLGGWMLTQALQRGWDLAGTTRVWLHTCSLDGPHARANYEARGMKLFDTVTAVEDLPASMPDPWPAQPSIP
jgi:GNAT superfamily N-acetyltransferase